MMRLARGMLLAMFMGCATPAGAQTPAPPPGTDPAENAKFRIGPFFMSPSFLLKDVGIDTNVFNEAEDPKRDFTGTLSPALTAGLRYRAFRLTYVTLTDYVYYHRYKKERSANKNNHIEAALHFSRLRPYFVIDGIKTRARPNAEIDARASRSDPAMGAGIDFRLSTRTSFKLTARRARTVFDSDQVFRGVRLAETLNRQIETLSAGMDFIMTPITTLVVSGETQRNRFDVATSRNTDSTRASLGLTFTPEGLLKGSALVGFRDFASRSGEVPSYRGPVSQVALSYVLLGTTRLDFVADRDVSYSFEPLQPYYVSTKGGLNVIQRLYGPIELIGFGARSQLDYRNFTGSLLGIRHDTLDTYGGRIGIRLGRLGQLLLNAEQTERGSTDPVRRFTGLRIYGSYKQGLTP